MKVYEWEIQKYVYCPENCSPSQCKKMTNRQSQVDILKRSYRCFPCLNQDTPLKGVLQNKFVETAVEKATFLFVTKEKTEVAMRRKKKKCK